MKAIFISLLFTVCVYQSIAQTDTSYREVVRTFVNCFKYNDRTRLSELVSYPLYRAYPLPVVNDKKDFLKRFDEIFDIDLINAITNSSIEDQWGLVGWRGIAFGDVWLSEDGNLIAINQLSPAEKERRQRLIDADRLVVYTSLKIYEEPICILETSGFRVRIDMMKNGKYRYASWPLKSKMSDPPRLVIENGTVEFDGTGGNHTYQFKNGDYTYNCDVIFMGADDDPPARLTIIKDNKTILSQSATINGR